MGILKGFVAAYRAFREAYTSSDLLFPEDFDSFDGRRLRYAVNWAFYENTAYRDIHKWANKYKIDYALYRWARNIYNPSYRIGEFYKAHIFGGPLETAIPIDNEDLVEGLSEVYAWSNWEARKDIMTLWGTVFGDVFVEVVDDVMHDKVYLDVVHPGKIFDVDMDPYGNVKGYTLVEQRNNPQSGMAVTYKEIVGRDGDYVVYETFLNDEPWHWDGNPAQAWGVRYGFVPMVAIKHNDVGAQWGWSELHPIRAKVHELDDLASMISDQVRKHVDPVWLMKGISQPTSTTFSQTDTSDLDADRPEPGRERLNMLWDVPTDGGAEPMVANLNLNHAMLHLKQLMEALERDYPELRSDIHTSSGDASGRALRVARQPVVSKVIQRRANYDAAMVKANQMALSIGGMRGYFPFSLDSYTQGVLDHDIADRPVFESDPLDEYEVEGAFWKAAKTAIDLGVSLEAFLRRNGVSDDDIERLTNAPAVLDSEQPEA